MTANAGTIPWERVRKAGSKLTTPLPPDEYLSSPSARTGPRPEPDLPAELAGRIHLSRRSDVYRRSMADPWQLLTSSQKKAMGLVTEAFEGVVKLGRDTVTQPEETLHRLTALVAAVGDLAASSTKPMESLLASQRNLANAMTSFAQLQKEMAEVVDRLAASHNAVVDAMEKLAGPALTVSELIRSEPVVEKAQERAKKK